MEFNKEIFEGLAQKFSETNNKVTIYVKTDRVGNGEAARIRLKNQLNEAVDKLMDERLQDEAMTKNEALGYLDKGFALLDDEEFWRYQSDGLAMFVDDDSFAYYHLPMDFDNFTYVGNVFHLRQVLPLVDDNSRFFILALSQNEVRFFEGRRHSITPVIISDLVPANFEEAMAAIDIQYPAELQAHSGGGHAAQYHGQGGEKDGKKDRLIDYFRMIDKGLMEMLYDERVPMVIAAVDYLVPLYKQASDYSFITEDFVSGNVEHDDPATLHEKAWAVISSQFEKDTSNYRESFRTALTQDQASLSINDIAPAALNGRVETLFIDENTSMIWGLYNEKDNTITIQKEQTKHNTCLINFAAISTYLQGGKVITTERAEMPHNVSVVNAIYRY